MACGPGHPGLSKSYMGMASKLSNLFHYLQQVHTYHDDAQVP